MPADSQAAGQSPQDRELPPTPVSPQTQESRSTSDQGTEPFREASLQTPGRRRKQRNLSVPLRSPELIKKKGQRRGCGSSDYKPRRKGGAERGVNKGLLKGGKCLLPEESKKVFMTNKLPT